jgi:hypothetical protein
LRTYLNIIFLLAIIILGCGKKHEEIILPKASKTIDTVQNRLRIIPALLPEKDTIIDAVPCLRVIKGSNGYILFDSVRNDTFNLYKKPKRINKALLSPTRKYIACLVHIATVDEPGIWENKPVPKRSYEHLVIVNAISPRVIREMKEPSDCFISIGNWISKSRILVSTDDGFAVGGCYVYDAFLDSLQEVSESFYIKSRKLVAPNQQLKLTE